MALTRWQPNRDQEASPWQLPTMGVAIGRGLRCVCPACGQAHLFAGYLRVVKQCAACATPLGLARSDDLPPYVTILIVGHIIVPLMLVLEKTQTPPIWVISAIFLPLTLILTLGLLRPIKGGTVGLMLKLGLVKPEQEAG